LRAAINDIFVFSQNILFRLFDETDNSKFTTNPKHDMWRRKMRLSQGKKGFSLSDKEMFWTSSTINKRKEHKFFAKKTLGKASVEKTGRAKMSSFYFSKKQSSKLSAQNNS
jgi:hypothetical protein